ncbi:hypothetical protein SAMN05216548_11316 [Faunimonas pinastri]|uniref:Uncharacterized protein n=1 Tax=Faunimonas pinastri TaxID=1855383 RepID=A0A1H9M9Q0_9HYPH|nr:hypothetical protein [Faunimonas pinastri]SER20185.1 hypothetical protein SAMN05216548_11316 [Faunimonas pinastri]
MASAQAIDWAALRRAYEAREGTIAGLCRTFGISAGQFRYRRAREEWRRQPTGTAAVVPPEAAATPQDIHERLYRSLEAQLSQLEEKADVGFDEGDARHVAEIAKAMAQMSKLETATREGAGASRKTKGQQPEHGDNDAGERAWMRDELKRRLARLRGAARLAGAAGGKD